MSDDADEDKASIPAWVMTFADLMSLLMCFFVLLLSFSEIDARRFKQIAGELAVAFGVQREVPALEVPMGTSAVFKDFSPGKPEPTLVDQVRQQTTTQDPQVETNTTQNPEPSPNPAEQMLQKSAQELREALAKELQNGQLQMEEEKRRIILRVEEKGSFPSGSAELTPAFEDMLDRMAGVLTEIPGELTIEGHTDNVPISTLRFHSNWDLSAARASAVANALLFSGDIEPGRLKVQGFAETRPRAANDSVENRALNRRVEIIIDQTNGHIAQDERLRSLLQGEDAPDHQLEIQRNPSPR